MHIARVNPVRQVARIAGAALILADSTHLALPPVDAIITDPPYGIGYKVNARLLRPGMKLKATAQTVTEARGAIANDDTAFDPAPWLALSPRAAFFGAQHFSPRLPVGRWLVWDKRCGGVQDSHSDCDLVWMTGDSRKAMRVHRQKWRGVVREGEENCSRSKKLHPNQKPVALLGAIMDALDLQPGQIVLDPYMGSGSTGVAALRKGLQFVGCEVDPAHFNVAVARLQAEFGV